MIASQYNIVMPAAFEADVALIHIAGGSSRSTPPPGCIAQSAPRRAARGRSEDLLFLNLALLPDRSTAPGFTTHLAQLGTEVYYGTPGSVTAGLREVVTTINDRIVDANHSESGDTKLLGQLLIAVLRGSDFYIAQCGIGHSILIRPGALSYHTSEQASNRPLGVSSIPYVRYHHMTVNPGDLVILTTAEPPVWAETTLESLIGLSPAQLIERLTIDITRDISGMVVGIAASGSAESQPTSLPSYGVAEVSPSFQRKPTRAEEQIDIRPLARPPSKSRLFFRKQRMKIRRFFSGASYSLARVFARLTPGLSEPDPTSYSPKMLMATAIIVPIVVVFIASIVYFQRGRAQQYQLNIADARAAIATAERSDDEQEVLEQWLLAKFWLEEAGKYGTSEEYDFLYEKVGIALDDLDRINRLSFQAVVSGGFGPDAEIDSLAATSSELYVLDTRTGTIWHLWATGQTFDLDGDFQCLETVPEIGTPVDLVIEPSPSAFNAESILAIDELGNLVYCAPDEVPVSSRLTTPDLGWGKIEAFDLYNNQLYVMDTAQDAVWVYDSTSGLVSGRPTLYFVDQIPDLADAIDIAASQIGLLILYADGHVDQCNRSISTNESVDDQFSGTCKEVSFTDDRAGHAGPTRIPGASPKEILNAPAPESELLFLDSLSGGVFLYGSNLAYLGQYQPEIAFNEDLTAMALGPPNSVFIAAGSQVFHAFVNP